MVENENAVLEVKNLSINFGGLKAVENVSFNLKKGQIVGLIGPNGAGKTTIFNLLTGVYAPTDGSILLNNDSIVDKKTYQINQAGVARTFQNIRLFKSMTVLENVKTAMNSKMKYPVISGVLRTPGWRNEEELATQRAINLLRVLDLDGYAHAKAGSLPYGQQRKLEIVRALATRPRVLLLDEPAAGMNPTETRELLEAIQVIRELFSLSILLIEHDMTFVMEICEYIFVLDYGRIIASGVAETVRNDPRVIAAYLGGGDTDGDA